MEYKLLLHLQRDDEVFLYNDIGHNSNKTFHHRSIAMFVSCLGPLLDCSQFVKLLNYLASNRSILRVSDEGYSRNTSCALNLISTILLYHIVIHRRPHPCSNSNRARLQFCLSWVHDPVDSNQRL